MHSDINLILIVFRLGYRWMIAGIVGGLIFFYLGRNGKVYSEVTSTSKSLLQHKFIIGGLIGVGAYLVIHNMYRFFVGFVIDYPTLYDSFLYDSFALIVGLLALGSGVSALRANSSRGNTAVNYANLSKSTMRIMLLVILIVIFFIYYYLWFRPIGS